jgi:hypothetical protein
MGVYGPCKKKIQQSYQLMRTATLAHGKRFVQVHVISVDHNLLGVCFVFISVGHNLVGVSLIQVHVIYVNHNIVEV